MTTPETEASHPAAEENRVASPEQLFLYSGLTDALRDAARTLLRHQPVSAPAREAMVVEYAQLRELLAGSLRPDLGAETMLRSPELEASAEIDTIYVAVVALARWIDVILSVGGFLVTKRFSDRQIAEAGAQAEGAAPQLSVVAKDSPQARTAGAGNYL